MEMTHISAVFKFGANIKTTFIDGDGKRAETMYCFQTGPGLTFSRTNDMHRPNGVWELKFDCNAILQFDRQACHFKTATVVQNGNDYEMFVTVMFGSIFNRERLIYSVKEL